jgi:hypothetical protein
LLLRHPLPRATGLEGASLQRVPHLDTFWFAQAAFEPDTVVIELGSRR